MIARMGLPCLRPDLPEGAAFTITELPHVAKLDQNESAVDLPPPLKQAVLAELAAAPWNRYPQPAAYRAARATLATSLGLPPECVALTVGADQVIQAAFLLAGGPGRRARWFEPTYPYVALAARATGTLGDPRVLGLDVTARLDAAAIDDGPRADLVVLVSPNNPTGGLVELPVVDAALADPTRLVLLDEAYADFSGVSLMSEAATRRNLIVARSLSKSLSAAVRLGYAVAHPAIIAALERIYAAPYHLNLLQLALATRHADLLPHVRTAAAAVSGERERVGAALAAMPGAAPRPSHGNFVCFGVRGTASVIASAMARHGVRVRDVSGLPGAGESLRVTIGKREENDVFLARLGELLASLGAPSRAR
jgi:histidinol-phosphate aminotransferase